MAEDIAYHDLPASAFPFTVEFIKGDEVIHTIEVTGPGALYIPGFGGGVDVLIRWPDGSVTKA